MGSPTPKEKQAAPSLTACCCHSAWLADTYQSLRSDVRRICRPRLRLVPSRRRLRRKILRFPNRHAILEQSGRLSGRDGAEIHLYFTPLELARIIPIRAVRIEVVGTRGNRPRDRDIGKRRGAQVADGDSVRDPVLERSAIMET